MAWLEAKYGKFPVKYFLLFFVYYKNKVFSNKHYQDP